MTLILCCNYKVCVASSFIAAIQLVKYKSSVSHFPLPHLHVAETAVKKKKLNFSDGGLTERTFCVDFVANLLLNIDLFSLTDTMDKVEDTSNLFGKFHPKQLKTEYLKKKKKIMII